MNRSPTDSPAPTPAATPDASPHSLPWLRHRPAYPLCDIPWLGRTVVLSTGEVFFCCFSDKSVGNVNQSTFSEIWNGETMQRIRHTLAEQRFPPECQSVSCPLQPGGGGMETFLERIEGQYRPQKTGTHDPHRAVRLELACSTVEAHFRPEAAAVEVVVELKYTGTGRLLADLFVSWTDATSATRFVPDHEPVPFPWKVGLRFPRETPHRLTALVPMSETTRGPVEICAALFVSGTLPNIPSNCFWSHNVVVDVPPSATRT